MKKKLKIKFWKAEKALVMQILEQEGLPEYKVGGFVRIVDIPAMYKDNIYLRGKYCGNSSMGCFFAETNQDRDEYLDKITQAITDELFTNGRGGLWVEEKCEFSDDKKDWVVGFYFGSILGRNAETEFLSSEDMKSSFYTGWKYARPLAKCTKPKIETNGEIITYTWEEE